MIRAELTEKILSQKRLKKSELEDDRRRDRRRLAGLSDGRADGPDEARARSRPSAPPRCSASSQEEKLLLQEVPYRGSLPAAVPTDPLIYRFYELVQVYGTTWKELIQEEFGDGIMSAIDFDMTIERQPDPKGDRVKLTLSGKFLPYKEY